MDQRPDPAPPAAEDPVHPEPQQGVVLPPRSLPVRPAGRWAELVRRPGVAAAAGATATVGLGLAVSVARQALGAGRRGPAAVEITGRVVHHVVHHHVVHVVDVTRAARVLPPGR
ncbi:hypothetical protein [Vallicoccus soli]|uniref:Uncharacterized protein n=1 Tax=Vallicoccus soli TaxID=2339232 RepID=A0A3A3Z4T0_9ACTN|nr:hypothetical protein [Vallicoccus soli]RJK96738.1 hypothetical protein D5H78_05550 [Vallicoccus soli]